MGRGAVRLTVAVLLWGAGAAGLGWAGAVLGWRRWLGAGGAPLAAETPRLVLSGPFGIVRHPQTLSLLLVLGGAVLCWPWPWVWVPALMVATGAVALAAAAERGLVRRFGEAYQRYQRAVPFLLPRWR